MNPPLIPFVVEDGSIVPGANSLCTVDFADAVAVTDFTLGPAWLAIADPVEKELRLISATSWLHDNVVWRGDRVTDPLFPNQRQIWDDQTPVTFDQSEAEPDGTSGQPRPPQPLDWPRRGAFDRETRFVREDVVPQEVQVTLAKVAMYFMAQAAKDAQLVGVQTFRADTFELIFQQGFMGRSVPASLGYGLYGLGQIVCAPGTKKIRKG